MRRMTEHPTRIGAKAPFAPALVAYLSAFGQSSRAASVRYTEPVLARLPARLKDRRLVTPLVVAAAMLAAYWWAREAVPGFGLRTLWAPYFLGPMGWVAAAAVIFAVYRHTPAPAVEGVAPPPRLVLGTALLVGVFLVSAQVILGMLTNFGSSPFAHTPRWLAMNFLFAGAPLVAMELARATVLRTAPRARGGLMGALVASTVVLVALKYSSVQLTEGGTAARVEFWGSVFLPAAALGLLAGFFAVYGGVRAALLVVAPGVLFTYYSPFLPVAAWPMVALVGVGGPAIGLWVASSMFVEEEEAVEDDRSHLPAVSWLITTIACLSIFWFSFGFFGYQPTFIPSHSMEPTINQGDVVLLHSVDPADVQVGDVIAYRLGSGQRVLHRVVEIITGESGEREFITQGDANPAPDLKPVAGEQIEGRYVLRVPKIGWVPLKFHQWVGDLL